MPSPTRYPGGVNNRRAGHPMGQLPFFDPTKYFVFFDDFEKFVTAASGVSGWHKDEVNTGSDPVVQDLPFGVIKFVIDNADNDNAQYVWGTNTTVHNFFLAQAAKRMWLRTRFKVEDADKNLPMIGLHGTQDDPWGTEPADQFLFRVNRGSPGALQFAAGKTNSTEVTVALGDLADDTYVTLTAFYDGKGSVLVTRESDAGVITHSGTANMTSSSTGDLLPDAAMGVAFGMEMMDTGADDCHIDYIFAAIER